MTGPEHYKKAEWLLARRDIGPITVAMAQAHATLALAAATAAVHTRSDWEDVTS